MEADPAGCPSINRAHRYLLEQEVEQDPPLSNLKGCANTVETYLDLLQPRPLPVHLNLLISLVARLERLGLSPVLMGPQGDPKTTLAQVRSAAKREIETLGKSALEPLGVNARLFEDLSVRPEVLREFMDDANCTTTVGQNESTVRRTLENFLSTTITEVRCDLARDLVQDLWARERLFNFRTFSKRLSDLEHNRAYYSGYRDHVNHQVLFFLLGAYVYYNCPELRTAVDREITRIDEDLGIKPRPVAEEFLFRLKLIATFHDVGYLFEVEPAIEDEHAKREERRRLVQDSLHTLESFHHSFLTEYFSRGLGIAGVDVDKLVSELAQKIKPYPPSIDSSKDLYRLPIEDIKHLFRLQREGPAEDPFWVISSRIEGSRIGKDLIARYFDLCRKTPLEGLRLEYLDHGIMSALVLLKACDIQRHYLSALRTLAFQGQLPQKQRILMTLKDSRTEQHLKEEQFYARFAHVAAASALHNIYPAQYTKDQCLAFGLNGAFYDAPEEQRFGITVEQNALSYLAALVDALQDWDRHSFRAPAFGDRKKRKHPISAAEVLIEARDGKIHIVPLSERAAERYDDQRRQLRNTLIGCDEYVILDDPGRLLKKRAPA